MPIEADLPPLSETAQRVWRYIQARQWQPVLDLDRDGHPFPSSPEAAQPSRRRRGGVHTSATPAAPRRRGWGRQWPQSRRPSWPGTNGTGDHSTGPHADTYFRVGRTGSATGSADRLGEFASRYGGAAASHAGAAASHSHSGSASDWGGSSTLHPAPSCRLSSRYETWPDGTSVASEATLGPPRHTSTPATVAPPSVANDIISASQSQLRRFQRRRRPPAGPGEPRSGSPPERPAGAAAAEPAREDPVRTQRAEGCPKLGRPLSNAPTVISPASCSWGNANGLPPVKAPTEKNPVKRVTSVPTDPAPPPASSAAGRRNRPSEPREIPRFSLLSPFGLGDSPLPASSPGGSPQAPGDAEPLRELSEEVPDLADSAKRHGSAADSLAPVNAASEHARDDFEAARAAYPSPDHVVRDDASASDHPNPVTSLRLTPEQADGGEAEPEQLLLSQSTVCGEVERLIDDAVPSPRGQPVMSEPGPVTSELGTMTSAPGSVMSESGPTKSEPTSMGPVMAKSRPVASKSRSNKLTNVSEVVLEPLTSESGLVTSESNTAKRRSASSAQACERVLGSADGRQVRGSPASTRQRASAVLSGAVGAGSSSTERRTSPVTRRSPSGVKASSETKSHKSGSPSTASRTSPKNRAPDRGRRADAKDDAQLMGPPLHPVFRGRRAKKTVRTSCPGAQPSREPQTTCRAGQPGASPSTATDNRSSDSPSFRQRYDQSSSEPGRAQKRSAAESAIAGGKRRFTAPLRPVTAGDPAVTTLTTEDATSVTHALQDPATTCVCLCLEHEDGGSELRPAAERRAAARGTAVALIASVTGGPLDGRAVRLRPDYLPEDAAAATAAALLAGPGRRVCCGARELLLFALRRCGVSAADGLRRWRLRDLAVADWLLGPDRPARGFPALLAELGGEVGAAAARDAALSRQQQLAEDARQLAAADAALSRRLRTAGLLELFERVETPLAAVLAAMEARGVRVDVARLHASAAACQRRLRWLEAAAHRAAGTVFSLASPAQLRRLLYEQLRLDARAEVVVPLTDHGLKSTCEQALQRLTGVHPLPGLLLQHRRVLKLKSTYVDGVLAQVRGGAVYPRWLQTAAATGRVQAATPNLQSVPKRPLSLLDDADGGDQKTIVARAPFVARAGHALFAVDFCQMELRLLAHLSRDARLTAAIRDAPGGDIFRQLAALWTACPAAAVDEAQRESTKRLVYAAMYGAGRGRLAEVLECPPEQAQDVLDGFLAKCPAIGAFSRDVVARCRRDGFVTSLLGRRRWMAAITSAQQQVRSQAERQAVNFSIQGSAADLCKLVMLAVTEAAPDVPLLAQLHDELLWEVPRPQLASFRALVEEQVGRMDQLLAAAGHQGPLLVPLPVAVSSGDCWAAMEPMEPTEPTEPMAATVENGGVTTPVGRGDRGGEISRVGTDREHVRR